MIGDNQFELFRSVEDALLSMERPEAASGDYFVFDETGQKYEFVVDSDDSSQIGSFDLRTCEGGGLDELLSCYCNWISYNAFNDLPKPSQMLFDDLEAKWGLA
ncbi:MAG: hypothetical protein AAGL10_02280 [Pseudomonadota bacterium]